MPPNLAPIWVDTTALRAMVTTSLSKGALWSAQASARRAHAELGCCHRTLGLYSLAKSET
jgi:hypothetical protein